MIELVLALVVGVLYGSGVYLLLRRNLLKFILALGLLSNGTHLLIFMGAGTTRGSPPLIESGSPVLEAPFADPLPQALILTAIVISFALTAFTVILVHRAHRATGTDDPDDLTTTDHLGPYHPPARPEPDLPGIRRRDAGVPAVHDEATAHDETALRDPAALDDERTVHGEAAAVPTAEAGTARRPARADGGDSEVPA